VPDDLPDDLAETLAREYAHADDLGLDPTWHDDEHGFDYDCPRCVSRGKPSCNRQTLRFLSDDEAQALARAAIIFAPGQQPPAATGPAG
jgi:hypothetical protein